MSLTVWIFSGKKKLSGEFCGETELGKQIEPLMYPLTSIHGEPHGKPPSLLLLSAPAVKNPAGQSQGHRADLIPGPGHINTQHWENDQ